MTGQKDKLKIKLRENTFHFANDPIPQVFQGFPARWSDSPGVFQP